MSSPNLNNIIILGCVLIYVSGILFGIDGEVASGKAHERVCQVIYHIDIFRLMSISLAEKIGFSKCLV